MKNRRHPYWDSGSKVGNEANIGLDRSSSDDPATAYSLLNPEILDFENNKVLMNTNCIYIQDGPDLCHLSDMRLKESNTRIYSRQEYYDTYLEQVINQVAEEKEKAVKNEWRQTRKYQSESVKFTQIWNDPAHESDAAKIIALLNDYTQGGDDISHKFFDSLQVTGQKSYSKINILP